MRCGRCGTRRDTHRASHTGAGSYNRAPRWYRGWLCVPCAQELTRYITEGHHTVTRWDVRDVQRVAASPVIGG